MHGSAVDDTTKRTSRAGTKPRLDGHEHDAMQCDTIRNKDMIGQSFIEQAPHTHSKGKLGWCYNTGAYSSIFSLKCFLLKSITILLRKAKQRYKARKNNLFNQQSIKVK